jgi:nucleoside-diphosphate-sugar epimerase
VTARAEPWRDPPDDEGELERRLSDPTPALQDALRRCPGDIIVLGAGGKMGPSLARMARRAVDALGDGRRVLAVSRWSSASTEHALRDAGVETISADLLDRDAVARLPDAPNVVYMAGQKFGTTDAPWLTWAANAVVPAWCAERYAESRIVAFSTGNVYPLVPVSSGGARESHPLATNGEYGASCVARERVFEWRSRARGTRVALVRLNYAVDLRYGVLVDVARRVAAGEPVDLTMGWANVIWQGDANERALRLLEHAAAPPLAVNVTGADAVRIRDVALRLGTLLGREPRFTGQEAPDALLSDASLSTRLLGTVRVVTDQLVEWVAHWIARGGPLLGKPTHFEARDGRY